jgi:hypothetical protein
MKLNTLSVFLENCGKQQGIPIFKQTNWLKEHYGIDVFRAIVLAANTTTKKNKLPTLNRVKKSMIASGDKTEEIELTLKIFVD